MELFRPYVSLFRDPGMDEASTILRTRYMENLKANDELALAVDQMKAALPFENDVKRKNEIQQEINNTLEQMAGRADYENLGLSVYKAAKKFTKDYSPVKENYERYQAAITSLGEQYDKGQINSEQYALAPGYMTRNYKGFEIDPTTGSVKSGTMFSAPTIYKDPKIMDLVTKRLEMLQMQKRGYEEGSVVTDENGTYKRKVGEYTELIPEADVMEVYNAVIKEPDVAAYLKQMADMKTYAADSSGQTQVVLQANQKQYQNEITRVQTAIATETDEAKKATYQTQLAALQEASGKIDAAMKDPALASSMMRDYFQEEILAPVKQYAMKKAGLFTYKEESGIAGGGDTNSTTGGAGGLVPLMQYDQVRASMDVSGVDHKSKMNYIATTDQQIAALTAEIQNADASGYSDEIKANLNNSLNSLINSKNRVLSQMKEAADSSVSLADLESVDKKIVDVVRTMAPNASSGELYTEIQRIFDNPGDQDYMNFQAEFDKQFGQGEFDKHITSGSFVKKGIVTKFSPEEKAMAAGMSLAGQEYGYQGGYKGVAEKFQNALSGKVNAKYAEIKESRLYNMGLIETGMGKKADIQTTKAVRDFFGVSDSGGGRGIMQEEIVTVQLEDGSVKQVNGNDPELQGYTIEKVGWDATSNTFKLSLTKGEGEKATVRTAIYDGNQIRNEGLTATLNNPEVRFGTAVMNQRSSLPGKPAQLVTVKIKNEPVIINIYSRGDESPYISITKRDGTPFLKTDIEKGTATKHNLNEQIIKDLINSRDKNTNQLIVTGY